LLQTPLSGQGGALTLPPCPIKALVRGAERRLRDKAENFRDLEERLNAKSKEHREILEELRKARNKFEAIKVSAAEAWVRALEDDYPLLLYLYAVHLPKR
jgi:hypothetical protein